MKGIRALPVTLALTLLLAACGQPATPSPSSPEGEVVSEGGQDYVQRRVGGLTAASADCNVVPNQSGYCYQSAPLSQYRFFVRCYDDGIANRIISVFGMWRNQGGTYRSYATCPAGDEYQTFGFDFR